MTRRLITIAFLATLTASPILGASLDARGTEVTASGFGAGEQVVVFGVMRQNMTYVDRLVRVDHELVADASGTAVLLIPDLEITQLDEVPFRSVWIAAGVSTGRYAMATPEGFQLIEQPFPNEQVTLGGDADRFTYPRPRVEAYRVQPGVGAWRLAAIDGTPADDGPLDSSVTVSLGSFEGTTELTTPAPAHLGNRDLLVVVDTDTLEVSVADLGEAN